VAPGKRAKIGQTMFHSYTIYTYSERGQSGLQEDVLFQKSSFSRKIGFRGEAGVPLK